MISSTDNRSNFLIQVAYSLVFLSVVSIFIDLLFGLEVHAIGSQNLSYIYRLIFILKPLLALVAIFYVRDFPLKIMFLLIFVFLVIKIAVGLFSFISLKAYIQHLQFYFYIITGYILGWYFWRYQTSIQFSYKFISFWVFISFLLCLIYFVLFQLGFTTYFGLGSQLWILTALVLIYERTLLLQSIIFLSILFSGKRSILLIFIAQVVFPKLKLSSIKNLNIFYAVAFIISLGSLVYFSDLGTRFTPFVDLFYLYDPMDEDQNRLLAYLATSGRSEEFFGYFVESELSAKDILLGVNPGHAFYIVDLGEGGQLLEKEFFHVSFLNYFFHFGFIFGSLVLYYQVSVFIWAVRNFEQRKETLSSLYIPYFLASFFGAIVVIDVLFWILFFYCSFLKRNEV